MKKLVSKKFILFLLTGGIAFGFNFLSRIIFNFYFSFSISIVLAYIVGMITAYILFKNVVFLANNSLASQNSSYKSIAIFLVTNLLAIGQTWAVSMLLVASVFPVINFDFFNQEIAHLIGLTVPLFTSYFMHKNWTFGVHASKLK